MSCIRGTYAGVELAMGDALALADALGCPRTIAGPLLAAFGQGLASGLSERRERDGDAGQGHRQPPGQAGL